MNENIDKNIQAIIDALKNLPEIDLPIGFHQEAMAKVRQEAAKPKTKPRKWRRIYTVAGSLAAAAAIFAAVFMMPLEENAAQQATDFALTEPQTAEIETPMRSAIIEAETGIGIVEFAADIAPMTPISADFTLEEQFENITTDTTLINTTSFPEHLPTETINFHTEDRFAISFELRVVTEDFDAALQIAGEMVGEMDYIHSWQYGDLIRNDLAMAFEFEELEEVFTALYDLGVVEEYSTIIVDTWLLEDEEEAYLAMEAHGNVILTLIGEAD